MESSDDEADLPQSVSQYWFADEMNEAVSFGVLPIKWTENEDVDVSNEDVFVRGTADNGLMKFHKQVIAWKIDLDNIKPEIWVLTKEKTWIKLEKPRKSYENMIRSILITVHCFHFVKRNPEMPEKSLWDQLNKVFSSYESKPSQNDLVDQRPLISEAVKKDISLGKSKFLTTFLEEKLRKRKPEETVAEFIVDDDEDDGEEGDDDKDDDDDELFDSVCAFCDNGGDLICCEGSCLRSFHATVEAGEESICESLGFSEDEYKAMEADDYFCKNCQHKQHQCFACGKLGSSDKESLKAEVFRCSNATCGHFYHPRCIAKLICGENVADAKNLQDRITEGECFTCPYHKCCVCRGIENKKITELQFAICRRCPTSYHRKCLPREISFEENEEEGIITRAWEDLLPNRILLYCLKHEIDVSLGTPLRDHIKFPEVEGKKTNKHKSAMKSSTSEGVLKKKKGFSSEDSTDLRAPKVISKKKEFASGSSVPSKTANKELKRPSSFSKGSTTAKKLEKVLSRSNSNPTKKVKVSDVSLISGNKSGKPGSAMAHRSSSTAEPGEGLGTRFFAYMNKDTEESKLVKQDTTSQFKKTASKSSKKRLISQPTALDADSERRLIALMKETESQITLESVMKKYKTPSTHAHSYRTTVDKNIKFCKVESSVGAVRTALNIIKGGGSTDDAAAVCEREVLNQIYKWKSKLRVYLAPFLHGMRYSSFGRHFTKVDKLEEIVDRLHWYVQNDDMIVDFCCGANDFSVLMKKKLEETGKSCSYKNYDILPPKNDFNFEQKDWMTVQPNELPSGSQLIMGLNPPFGVKAGLANKFIDKALEFNPKLLILIVPRETERLDQKKTPYQLVWEDDQIVSGKSFYLPGSVNVRDKQMDQWNVKPPVLYLWSRRDWACKHKSIAEKHGHGHLSNAEESRNNHLSNADESYRPNADESYRSNADESYHPQNDHGHDAAVNHGFSMQTEEVHNRSEKIMYESSDYDNKLSSHSLSDRQSQDENNPKERVEEKRPSLKPPSVNEPYNNRTNATESRSSFDGPRSNSAENPSLLNDGTRSNSHTQFRNDVNTMYDIGISEPYLSGRYKAGPEEPLFTGQGRNITDMLGYDGMYMEEPQFAFGADGFGYNGGPYKTGMEGPPFADSFGNNNIRHMYGQNPERRYDQMSPPPAMPYGFAGPGSEPSYSSSSVMDRYALRLDEPNPAMMGFSAPEPPRPAMINRGGFYDSRAPPPPAPPQPSHYHHQPGYGSQSMGFAPGPHHSYPYNSGGWLND